MKFEFLANHQQAIPIIAAWYFNEWGHLKENNSLEKTTKELQSYLNTDKIPLMLVALEGDEPLGVLQLKYREMSIYPDKEHWLGGVYVSKKHRGRNIAEQMIYRLITIAKSLNVERLYLQTEKLEGGLYSQLGWQAIVQVNYRGLDVLVMEKSLNKKG